MQQLLSVNLNYFTLLRNLLPPKVRIDPYFVSQPIFLSLPIRARQDDKSNVLKWILGSSAIVVGTFPSLWIGAKRESKKRKIKVLKPDTGIEPVIFAYRQFNGYKCNALATMLIRPS
jgi:hypothetical protein